MALPWTKVLPAPQPVTRTETVPGWRQAQWIAHPLVAADRGRVAAFLDQTNTRLVPAKAVVKNEHDEVTGGLLFHLYRRAKHNNKDHSSADWDSVLDDYVEDLRGYSEAHIAEAISEHRKAHGWYPKINELVAILEPKRVIEAEQARRCRVLLGEEEPKAWERPREVDDGRVVVLSPERRARMEAAMQKMPEPLAESVRAMLPKDGV